MKNRSLLSLAGTLLLPGPLPAQQYTVVPAALGPNHVASYLWLPGASQDVRQQTLIGQSRLTAVLGRSITALELRRCVANKTYQGGAACLSVSLSTSPRQPLHGSAAFANNVGADAVQVFQGQVTLPTSPPAAGPVAWTPSNTIRIAFQTPFPYFGGTLCIDVTGTKVPGQTANWWMVAAVGEDLAGTIANGGDGCGQYGGAQGMWAHVSPHSLVPGGHAGVAQAGGTVQVEVASADIAVTVVAQGSTDVRNYPVPPSKAVAVPIPQVPPGTILILSVGRGLLVHHMLVEVVAP